MFQNSFHVLITKLCLVLSVEAIEVDSDGRGRLVDAFVSELCSGGEGAAFKLGAQLIQENIHRPSS